MKWLSTLFAILLATSAHAQVTGVVQTGAGLPIAQAIVRWPSAPQIAEVVTGPDGAFEIAAAGPGVRLLTAALAYEHNEPDRYLVTRVSVFVNDAGQGDAAITLQPIPQEDNLLYTPIKAANPGGCGDCHGEYLALWSQSAHASAAMDPWVNDLHNGGGTAGGGAGYVYTELHDPGETGYCAVCHAPNQNPRDAGAVQLHEISSPSAAEGVNCTACHQLAHVNDQSTGIHLLGNAELFFPGTQGSLATHEYVWGPLPDSTAPNMRTIYQPGLESSHYCASCHEYENPQTGVAGQTTFSEWQRSAYALAGPMGRSCQQCHMPNLAAGTVADEGRPGAIERPSEQRHQHRFAADASGDLASALPMALMIIAEGSTVRVGVRISNTGLGHAFPTGVDIRNALLPVRLSTDGLALPLIHGPLMPEWASDDLPALSEGDLAGLPGIGMAKVLAGRINGLGPEQQPVSFIDAERIAADSSLQPGEVRTLWWRYANPDAAIGQSLQAEAQLLYRRAWRALAVTKGWTTREDGRPVEEIIHALQTTQIIDVADLDRIFADGGES